jgi:threonine synthase
MGTPIGTLVCASNKNNILTDFLKEGVYDRNRAFHTTMSPSMDILISSNLERLLYTVVGTEKTAEYMSDLNKNGKYSVTKEELAKIRESFVGYYTEEEECKETIRDIYKNENSLIDTHTAVAVCAAKRYVSDHKTASPMLVVSTASPYKFAADVLLSLTGEKPEDDLLALGMLKEHTGVEIPTPLARTLGKAPVYTGVIERDDMKNETRKFASKN